MTILWIVLSAIGGLIVLVLLLAAVMKKGYSLERTIVVNKGLEDTYHFVSSIETQDSWSKWANLDPDMKKQYIGTDRTVGFISKWDSPHKNVGSGEQEIKKLIPNERVETEMRFLKPFRSVAQGYFTTNAIDENQTKVAWGFTGNMPYPFNFMLAIMNMEKMLGNDFEEGLANLKKKIEE
jgi:hypothetical protein